MRYSLGGARTERTMMIGMMVLPRRVRPVVQSRRRVLNRVRRGLSLAHGIHYSDPRKIRGAIIATGGGRFGQTSRLHLVA